MYCQNCGQKVKEGAVFCSKCGAKLADDASATKTVPERSIANDATMTSEFTPYEIENDPMITRTLPSRPVAGGTYATPPAGRASSPNGAHRANAPYSAQPTRAANAAPRGAAAQAAKKPSSKKPIIIAAIIALVVVIAAVAGFFVMSNQSQHKKYELSIAVVLDESTGLTSSPLPVNIEGTDFEGHAVSERYLATSDTSNCPELPRGTYKVTIAGSPILSDGSLCKYDSTAVEIEITEDSDNHVTLPSMTVIPVAETTSDQVKLAYNTLVDYGMDANEAKTYKDAADKRVQEYQDKVAAEKKAAEEAAAAQKAAEEAAAQAAAEAAAAKYETGASNVTLKAQWIEYKYGNDVIGTSGARVSVDPSAREMIVEIGGTGQPLSAGTYYYKIADNVTCQIDTGKNETLSEVASSLDSCFSKYTTGIGPIAAGQTAHATAYVYGSSENIKFTTQADGQVTLIKLCV